MREIKFRGKRIDNGQWVCGQLRFYDNDFCEIMESGEKRQTCHVDGKPFYQSFAKVYEVDPATVGQYTGLKDKNGKEIYEGDILHHKWNSGNDIFLETISEVKFSRGAFVVDDKKRADWLLSLHALPKWAEIEVIGNIYENPGTAGGGIT